MDSEEGLTLAFWKCSEKWKYTRITCLASKLTSLKGTTLIYMILVVFMKQNSLTTLQSHFSKSAVSSGLTLFLCQEFLHLGFSL